MLKYINNFSNEVKFSFEEKCLSVSGTVGKTNDKYAMASGGAYLLKINVSGMSLMDYKCCEARLNLLMEAGAVYGKFIVYAISSKNFSSAQNSGMFSRASIIDTISFANYLGPYGGDTTKTLSFDISKIMYQALNGNTQGTICLAFKLEDCSVRLFSMDYLKTREAVIQMQVSSVSGMDPIYEYDQTDMGDSGISNVNLATGRLIHKIDVISTPDEKCPCTLSLAFNPAINKTSYFTDRYWRSNLWHGFAKTNGNSGKVINFTITDYTGKETIYYACSKEDIGKNYGIDPVENGNDDYFMSLVSSEYALFNEKNRSVTLIDKSGNRVVMKYDDNLVLNLQNMEFSNGEKINIAYDEASSKIIKPIKSIKNSKGERLDFEYSDSDLFSAVRSYDRYGVLLSRVEFQYEDKKISKMKNYIGNNKNPSSESDFFYDAYESLTKIVDASTGTECLYEYLSDGRMSKISTGPVGEEGTHPYKTFDYLTFRTRIKDFTNHCTDYFFDYYGRCKSVIDDEGKSMVRNYSETDSKGNLGQVTSQSKMQINENNLIENFSFDSGDDLFKSGVWKLEKGNASDFKILYGGVYGQKCLRIEKKDDNDIVFSQSIPTLSKGVKYAFSVFMKALVETSGKLANGDIVVKVINEGIRKDVAINPNTGRPEMGIFPFTDTYALNNEGETSNWKKYKTVVFSDNSMILSNSKVEIVMKGKGYTAYLDDISLSYGDHQTRYNFVSNGYFNGGLKNWVTSDKSSMSVEMPKGTFDYILSPLSDRILKINGGDQSEKTVSQDIEMIGNAGEELVFTAFGQSALTSNDSMKLFLKIFYDDGTQDTYKGEFDHNFDSWQVVTRSVIPQKSYKKVQIGVTAETTHTAYFSGIQLYRDTFGKTYGYTQKRSLSELVDDKGQVNSISYNPDDSAAEVTDSSGDSYRFSYDDKKRVTQVTDNRNNRALFSYDDFGKTSTEIVSRNGDRLKTLITHDAKGNVASETDDLGNKTGYEYDNIGRNISKTDANGAKTYYSYEEDGKTKSISMEKGGEKISSFYSYTLHGLLSGIDCSNGTKYFFEYNPSQLVAKVTVDGKTFTRNEYKDSVNGVNTGLITKQYLSDSDEKDFYEFKYDDRQRLSSISFENKPQVTYLYTEADQICEVDDEVSGKKHFYSYDNNGNVTKDHDSDGNSIIYSYDNLGSLQKETLTQFGMARSFDYDYKYESNPVTPFGYFDRLAKTTGDEIIKAGSGIDGIHGGIHTASSMQADEIDASVDTPLGDAVPSFNFKDSQGVVFYDFSTFNTRSLASDKYAWQYGNRDRKTVLAWMKIYDKPLGSQRIFAFATGETSDKIGLSLVVGKEGNLTFYDNFSNKSISTSSKVSLGKWNLVGFSISKKDSKVHAELFLNGSVTSVDYDSKIFFDYITRFVIGDDPALKNLRNASLLDNSSGSNTGGGSSNNGNDQGTTVQRPFRLAFASVGCADLSQDKIKEIYEEGVKYLIDKKISDGTSGVSYVSPKTLQAGDFYSLNGSLISAKGNEPVRYLSNSIQSKEGKDLVFEHDEDKKRKVYKSFSGKDNVPSSILSYDSNLNDQCSIWMSFKIKGFSGSARTLMALKTRNNERLFTLAIKDDQIVCASNKHPNYDTSLFINLDSLEKWMTVGFSLDREGKLKIRFNQDKVLEAVIDPIDFRDSLLYVACDVDDKKNPISLLDGDIADMVISQDSSDLSYMGSISDVIVRTTYDDMGRTNGKMIRIGEKSLEKNYAYLARNGFTSTRIGSENDYTGNSISYDYDPMGNVSSIETKDKDGRNVDKQSFEYDGFSRLVRSTKGNEIHSYAYDSNNNILKKDDLTYEYDSVIHDRLVGRSDGLKIEYDDSFIGNPTKIIRRDGELDLSWFGRRLTKANDFRYTYDQNGLRTSKEGPSFKEEYLYDKDRLSALKHVEGEKETIVFFNYDEGNQLVGFTIGDRDCFYDRDVLGTIRSVIDIDGKILVKYEYDDWGKVISIKDDSGEDLSKLNPFLFKGYFYDRETGFYYLKTRYYDPDIGRFISADGEIGSVGNPMGMNLYAYCKDNPVNYGDENGNWPSWLTKVCIGLAVIAVCAIAVVATGGFGVCCIATSMLVGAVEGAAIGAISGAIMGGVTGAIKGAIETGSWEGALKGALTGAIDGAADGFMWGAIGGAISGAMNPSYCFVAGTLVATAAGMKKIEEIKKGDIVETFNPYSNAYEENEVTEVYVNKTKELVHVNAEGEIVSTTPDHPFLTEEGWKKAKDLTEHDRLQSKDGFKEVVSIDFESLDKEINVYNFSVQGYHIYVVGRRGIVVHNGCGSYEILDENGKTIYVGKGNTTRAKISMRQHGGTHINYCDLEGQGDKFSFMVEAAKMDQYTGLQNKIASPGKKLLEMASPDTVKDVLSYLSEFYFYL